MLLFIMQVGNVVLAQDLPASVLLSSHTIEAAQAPITQLQTWKLLDKTASMSLAQIDALSDASWQPLKGQVTGYHFMEKDYWAAAQGAVLWLKMKLRVMKNSCNRWKICSKKINSSTWCLTCVAMAAVS